MQELTNLIFLLLVRFETSNPHFSVHSKNLHPPFHKLFGPHRLLYNGSYASFGISHTCGKQMHDRIISLREEG